MGFFNLTASHTDDGDDEAGLACMITNSYIPDDYESFIWNWDEYCYQTQDSINL